MNQSTPLIILAASVAIVLAAIAIRRAAALTAILTGAGLLAAMASIPAAQRAAAVWPNLFESGLGVAGFETLILASALLILVIAATYWQNAKTLPREEFFLLLLIATIGACVLAAAKNYLTLFLGLETMTLAMLGMIAYPRDRPDAAEAALKYLVLSAMSSAFLLFGIGLLELSTGSLDIATTLAAPADPMTLAALAMIGIAAGFKLSVVPFHIWVPDIYAGAPAPAGAFIAVIPKIAVLAVLVRLIVSDGLTVSPLAVQIISVVALLSMLAGNLLALQQQNLKRVFGYSSIAHLGYLLVAILAAGAIGPGAAGAIGPSASGAISQIAVVFYVVTYALTMIAAFAVIAALSAAAASRDADQIADLRGLFWTRPGMAAVMTMALLSLAGIPPAIGFIAKMYIFAAGIHTDLWLLIATMIASSVIGLFYYLSILIAMTQKPAESDTPEPRLPVGGRLLLSLLGFAVFAFGVAPQPLISLLKTMFTS